MKRLVEYTVEVTIDEDDAKELKIQENVIREMLSEAVPDATITVTNRKNIDEDDEEDDDDDDGHYARHNSFNGTD
jgi:hypothetical protein